MLCKKYICFVVCVLSFHLSANDWKTAGEYFEDQGDLGIAKHIYTYESRQGSSEAKRRLDLLGKKSAGNEVDQIRCRTAIYSTVLSDIEKYAVLGQSECMLELALHVNPIRSTYWLHRANKDVSIYQDPNDDVNICTAIQKSLVDLPVIPHALLENIDSCTGDQDLMSSVRTTVMKSEEYQIFSSRLKRLEFLMHLEDLYSITGKSSARAASLLKEARSGASNPFSKVVLELEKFQKAAVNYEQNAFFFWNLTLKSSLSTERVREIQSTFSRMFHQLIDFIGQFRYSESARQLYQNAIAQLQEQLEHLAGDYLATQKAHDAQIRYELNDKSQGLSVFQYVNEAAQIWMVSPNSEPKSQILEANEMLTVKVSGEWSPICAIVLSGKVNEPTTLRVGPEGYRTHVVKTNSESSGHDERESESAYSQTSHAKSYAIDWLKMVGVGLGAVVGTILLPGAGTILGMSLGGTATSPFSASDASHSVKGKSSSSDTSEFRHRSISQSQTALFQSGLRLEQTPYPRMPAGAYLVVVFSKEPATLGQIVDTFVVSSQSSYVASQKVEIFFVVNDCVDSRSSGALSVQIQKYRPANSEVNKLMTTMLKSLQVFSEKGQALVEEGGDLSSRIETLKAEVVAKLEQSSVADFMSEPTLRSVFMHWIQQEADKVIRQARMTELSRQMRLIHHDLNGKHQLLKLEQSKVDRSLEEQQTEVVEYATGYVLPILQLYGLKRDWNLPPQSEDDLISTSTEVKQVSEHLLKMWDTDELLEDFVVVRVPKPGNFLTVSERRQMPTLDDERSKQLWDHLFGNEDSGVQIRFSDVYQDVVQGGLLVNQELPVMMDMAVVLRHDSLVETEFLKSQFAHATVSMTLGSNQVFSHNKTYQIIHDDIRWHKIPVAFVNSEEFPTTFHLRSGRTAIGLSPFTTFSFGKIKNMPKERLQDVFLAMKVLYRRKLQ